jgi:hypothetical protein
MCEIVTIKSIMTPTEQAQYPSGAWGPARPVRLPTIWRRTKPAWLVFTGKADALLWQENPRCN